MKTDFQIISEAYESMNRITPTIEWMRRKYDEFNKEMFSNRLPSVEFGIIDNNVNGNENNLGSCDYTFDTETRKFSDFKISMSTMYRTSEHIFEDILIHEMIHLENMVYAPEQLIVNNDTPSSMQHKTKLFIDEKNRINAEFNRNISDFTDTNDKEIFKLSYTYRDDYMKHKNEIVFVFALLNDNFIIYGRSDEEKYKYLIDSFKNQFGNVEIEVIRPSNIYVGKRIKENKDYRSSGIFYSKSDYDEFKEFLTAPITESTEDNNEENIPDWVKHKKEEGEYVYFKDGKWFARMV